MGKLARLHGALKAELLQGRRFLVFEPAQAGLDIWRRHYNHERPHEALGGAVPASCYLMSQRSMPATLPEPEYLDDDRAGRVRRNGCVRCRPGGRQVDLQLSIAFAGQLAAVRPSAEDGVDQVWFSRYRIAEVDFRTNPDRPLLPISSLTCNPCLRSVHGRCRPPKGAVTVAVKARTVAHRWPGPLLWATATARPWPWCQVTPVGSRAGTGRGRWRSRSSTCMAARLPKTSSIRRSRSIAGGCSQASPPAAVAAAGSRSR